MHILESWVAELSITDAEIGLEAFGLFCLHFVKQLGKAILSSLELSVSRACEMDAMTCLVDFTFHKAAGPDLGDPVFVALSDGGVLVLQCGVFRRGLRFGV
jgi:hypothetical protein